VGRGCGTVGEGKTVTALHGTAKLKHSRVQKLLCSTLGGAGRALLGSGRWQTHESFPPQEKLTTAGRLKDASNRSADPAELDLLRITPAYQCGG